MKYVRGLDGLRAVAVIVVLLFHAEIPFFDGGFLGVSLFFTLSGFLITTLLLVEHEQSGDISLRRFYGRRARRLLPAAYVCLLLVAVSSIWWTAAQDRALRGDLTAAVTNIANWRFAFSSNSYQDLFLSAPSPVAHFWSLAIEEQIYLILPIVVLLSLRRSRRVLACTTAALLVASVASTLLTGNRDLVYNGTHTRAAELLVGVALAQLVFHERSTEPSRWRGDWIPGAFAIAAFAGLVVATSVRQSWVYHGGLVVVAVVSAVLIRSVAAGRFPARLLEASPLVAIGAVSYGIYLFHWPVFLLLDEERTGMDGAALFALRLAATALLTVASYRLVEQPVRRGRVVARDPVAVFAFALTAVVIIGAALLVRGPQLSPTEQLLAAGEQAVVEFSPPVAGLDAAAVRQRNVGAPSVDERSIGVPSVDVAAPSTTSAPARPRILVLGSERSALTALSGVDADVIDGLRPQQPVSRATPAGGVTFGSWLDELAERDEPNMIVIAVGAAEEWDAGQQLPIVGAEWKAAERELLAGLDEASRRDLPVLVYYPSPSPAPFDQHVERLELMRPWLGDVARTSEDLVAAVDAVAAPPPRPSADESTTTPALRVMVIGDSTSINMAKAINDGGEGRLAVMWAGANGCPLVAIDGTRVSTAVDWSSPDCEAYEQKLPPLLDRFQPDAVLLVLGPTELAEQRYPGDPNPHVAGDPAFAAVHGQALDALVGVLDADVPLLIADLPTVRAGLFVTDEMADPARLAAVNELVAAADDRREQVERFDYRDPLEAAERAFGPFRTDGVHPDAAPMENLARDVYVDQLIDQVASWRAANTPQTFAD